MPLPPGHATQLISLALEQEPISKCAEIWTAAGSWDQDAVVRGVLGSAVGPEQPGGRPILGPEIDVASPLW
jgi:hypothetical protein